MVRSKIKTIPTNSSPTNTTNNFYSNSGFAAGKANITPFHKVNRLAYTNRSHNFLYSPEMYGTPHK
jgi:hypothetical protein